MMAATPAKDSSDGMHLEDFGRLPVVHDGRVKPFDSLARNTLMIISGRQYVVDNSGNEQSAVKWLLDVMTSKINRGPAEKSKVFRIQNDQLLDLLGLAPRFGFRYAIEEFADKLPKLEEKATHAQKIPPKDQDKFDVKSIELAQHLQTYIHFSDLDKMEMIPPDKPGGDWSSIQDALIQQQQNSQVNKALLPVAGILSAYGKGDIQTFNRKLADYRTYLDSLNLPETKPIDFEAFFNHFEPFYQCMMLYVCVFVLGCLGFLDWTGPLGPSAFCLTFFTLVVHTWALLARMYLTDRWLVFVRNLDSSAVFFGL